MDVTLNSPLGFFDATGSNGLAVIISNCRRGAVVIHETVNLVADPAEVVLEVALFEPRLHEHVR